MSDFDTAERQVLESGTARKRNIWRARQSEQRRNDEKQREKTGSKDTKQTSIEGKGWNRFLSPRQFTCSTLFKPGTSKIVERFVVIVITRSL